MKYFVLILFLLSNNIQAKEFGNFSHCLNISSVMECTYIGDSAFLSELAPIEIGNYIWEDNNENGLQDACESGIDAIIVELVKAGTVIATTQTTNGGQYLFSDKNSTDINLVWAGTGADTAIIANTTYTVRISDAEGNNKQGSLNDFSLTTQDVGSNNFNTIDSDASIIGGTNAEVIVTTEDYGCSNHDIDFGFRPNCKITIEEVFATNCSGTDSFTADWNISIAVNGNLDTDISYQRNNETTMTHVLTGTTDTLSIIGIPADGAMYDTLRVWLTNDLTCADTVILKRPAPCPVDLGIPSGQICASVSPSEIVGTLFLDWDYDGSMNESDTIGVEGIQVQVYDCDGNLAGTTYSDASGNYQLTGLTPGEEYRVEFIPPDVVSCWIVPTQAGADSGTKVQFVQPGSCASLGMANPVDYCQTNPKMAIPCYINGNPSGGGTAGTSDALVGLNYTYFGQGVDLTEYGILMTAPLPEHVATNSEVGTTWGVAYQRTTRKLFASSFVKRHTGMGPLGEGGIYTMDYAIPSSPAVVQFLDVNTVGIITGEVGVGATPELRNSNRGLSTAANVVTLTGDPQAFAAVGKVGLGGLDISEDESTLWLINLNDQTLNSILIDADNNVATPPVAGDVNTFAVPDPCGGNTHRPFAVKYHRGLVYVGLVCENALEAYIYVFDGAVFTPVLVDGVATIPLNYTRGSVTITGGCAAAVNDGWFTWFDTPPAPCDGAVGTNALYVRPSPILSDIEFDLDGSLIISLMDRAGHQFGAQNTGYTGTGNENVNCAGDILRICKINGAFVMEGTAGCGSNLLNSQGPNGGEFYHQDFIELSAGGGVLHEETVAGGLALLPGRGEIAVASYDPFNTVLFSGGVNWFNNTDGLARDPGYLFYFGDNTGATGTGNFSEAAGVGDLEILCDPAPIEIGNYAWEDLNEDGIQDACEPGLVGVNIGLYNNVGTLLASATTDATGNYYFSKDGAANQTWITSGDSILANTDYYIVAGTGGQFTTNELTVGGNTYLLTLDSINSGANRFAIDSDGEVLATTPANAFDNLPATLITTGNFGQVDHSIDFGFMPFICKMTIDTTFVTNCSGTDPFFADWNISIITEDVPDMAISYQRNNDPVLTHTLTGTTDTLMIVGVPADGGIYDTLTVWFTNDITCADTVILKRRVPCTTDLGFEAGEICSTISNTEISGTVFDDPNFDGVMNGADTIGMEGIMVVLFDCNKNLLGTTYSDSNGNYTFSGLVTGADYQVQFVLPEAVSCFYKETRRGVDNGTNVQFVQPGNCASLGIGNPDEYCP